MTESTVDYSFFTDNIIDCITVFIENRLDQTSRRAIPMPDIYQEFAGNFQNLDKSKFTRSFSALVKDGKLTGYEIKLGKGGGIGRSGPPTVKAPRVKTAETKTVTVVKPVVVPTMVKKTNEDKLQALQKVQESVLDVAPVEDDAKTDDSPQPLMTLEEAAVVLPLPPKTPTGVEPVNTTPAQAPMTTNGQTQISNKDVDSPPQKSHLRIGDTVYEMPLSHKKSKDLLVYVFDLEEDPAGDIVLNDVHYTSECPNVRKYLGSFIWMMIEGSNITTYAKALRR